MLYTGLTDIELNYSIKNPKLLIAFYRAGTMCRLSPLTSAVKPANFSEGK